MSHPIPRPPWPPVRRPGFDWDRLTTIAVAVGAVAGAVAGIAEVVRLVLEARKERADTEDEK